MVHLDKGTAAVLTAPSESLLRERGARCRLWARGGHGRALQPGGFLSSPTREPGWARHRACVQCRRLTRGEQELRRGTWRGNHASGATARKARFRRCALLIATGLARGSRRRNRESFARLLLDNPYPRWSYRFSMDVVFLVTAPAHEVPRGTNTRAGPSMALFCYSKNHPAVRAARDRLAALSRCPGVLVTSCPCPALRRQQPATKGHVSRAAPLQLAGHGLADDGGARLLLVLPY
jgi:hypothetical protein